MLGPPKKATPFRWLATPRISFPIDDPFPSQLLTASPSIHIAACRVALVRLVNDLFLELPKKQLHPISRRIQDDRSGSQSYPNQRLVYARRAELSNSPLYI